MSKKLSPEQIDVIAQENMRLHADIKRFTSRAEMTMTYHLITKRTVAAIETLGYEIAVPAQEVKE